MTHRHVQAVTLGLPQGDHDSLCVVLRALGYHFEVDQTAAHQSGYSRLNLHWSINAGQITLIGSESDLEVFKEHLHDECLGDPYGHVKYRRWLQMT